MIAIMGAMSEEIQPLLSRIKNYEMINIAANKYYKGSFAGHDLVIAYSKIGKVNASLTANVLIQHFKAAKIIFTGVAGAINNELKIGDMIIAKSLVQHDVDITAFGHAYGFIPESGDFIDADNDLSQAILSFAKQQNLNIRPSILATGDQFVASSTRKQWIQETFKADALEMEGASMAYVAKSFDIPFCVLRAISDTADGNANIDFDEFLQQSSQRSAEFLFALLEHQVI